MPTIPAKTIKDDVSIVLCGEAGQGIQTVERLLMLVFKQSGYHVFATKEYMSRVRGGSNSTEIRVGSSRRAACVDRIDILIPLDHDALSHLRDRIAGDTVIIGDEARVQPGRPIVDAPFSQLARDSGGELFANTVAVGLMAGIFGIDPAVLQRSVESFFSRKSREIVDKNIGACMKGYELGRSFTGPGKIEISIRADASPAGSMMINGAEAVSLGAIAGGCDFIAAYPMTPSTGVITYFAEHAAEFGIIAEQAEDEIAAVNMAIGAWYAGARAMVATAGGGFALMTEGLSLAGMIESPLVISVGQRPAPATGLPTRTEQGDLSHVLYAGHGEFPRAVFAPGSIEQAFAAGCKAFELADRFQVPVFILSDQYLVDTYYDVPLPAIPDRPADRQIVKTEAGYARYRITADGISPRGVPGYGDGMVAVDSDEHDENGRITEDAAVRRAMVDKRLRKLDGLKQAAELPEFTGDENCRTLVVSWGSTRPAILEALERIGDPSLGSLHFTQVYPLHPSAAERLARAENLLLVENNATAQFGQLLRLHTGIDISRRILKYDGRPFSVEELTEAIRRLSVAEAAGAR